MPFPTLINMTRLPLFERGIMYRDNESCSGESRSKIKTEHSCCYVWIGRALPLLRRWPTSAFLQRSFVLRPPGGGGRRVGWQVGPTSPSANFHASFRDIYQPRG